MCMFNLLKMRNGTLMSLSPIAKCVPKGNEGLRTPISEIGMGYGDGGVVSKDMSEMKWRHISESSGIKDKETAFECYGD